MTLDEAAFSNVSDAALTEDIRATAYHGADIRPAWIGAHRPRTSVADLAAICNWASVHYDYYLNFVRWHMDVRGDVLDIGCGAGQAAAMLSRYANHVDGIDSDESVIAFANRHNAPNGVCFVCSAFPSGWFGDRRYDYIFCVETMEHIPYEQQDYFLQRALDLLKPMGRLFITTPNEQSASAPHVGVWSNERVAAIVAKFGAHVERRAFFSNTAPVGFLDQSSTHHAWVMK